MHRKLSWTYEAFINVTSKSNHLMHLTCCFLLQPLVTESLPQPSGPLIEISFLLSKYFKLLDPAPPTTPLSAYIDLSFLHLANPTLYLPINEVCSLI